MESEKQELSKVMGRYGIQWKHLGTHNKHLSVLNYKKQEREKEVAKLEQTLSDENAVLSEIVSQQILAEKEIERIKNEGETIRQEVSELSAKNVLLRQESDGLIEDRRKILSDNGELEQQQKKIQREINKMLQSKEAMERNIHVYDEDVKWQLPEPGMLMTAKSYREKSVVPLVTKLKDSVKSLTIKCVRLTEENKKLRAKTAKQAKDVEFYKGRMNRQSSELEKLQEKADDFECVKQYAGADKIDAIVTNARKLERIAHKEKQHNGIYGIRR